MAKMLLQTDVEPNIRFSYDELRRPHNSTAMPTDMHNIGIGLLSRDEENASTAR